MLLRGHGKSDKPHDVDKYGVEMAEDESKEAEATKTRAAAMIKLLGGVNSK
jgi:hypothetical protein